MIKRTLALLFCCAALLLSALPVYAADGDNPPETVITSGTSESAGDAQNTGAQKIPKPVIGTDGEMEPVDESEDTVDGVPYITRVYELAGEESALPLTESFEQDGYTFTMYDTYSWRLPDEIETREAAKTVTLTLAEDTTAALQAAASQEIEYSEDGFSGKLRYSPGDAVITPDGETSYSYRVTDVREYTNLDRNDAAYIPKAVTKNGVSLSLDGVEWVVMGTTPDGDSLVPNLFKAVATYSGAARGTKVSSYTATVSYSGTVQKTMPGKLLCSVTFRGQPIETAAEPLTEKPSVWPPILITLGIAAALGGTGAAVFFLLRRRKRMEAEQAEIEELVEKGEW